MTKHQPVIFGAFISLKAAACPYKVPTYQGSYSRQEMGGTLWASLGADTGVNACTDPAHEEKGDTKELRSLR